MKRDGRTNQKLVQHKRTCHKQNMKTNAKNGKILNSVCLRHHLSEGLHDFHNCST